MDLQFKGKYIISGKILCKTGLHIGGTQEGIEIGGIDNPVIRDPLTEEPYIPGSSLKGKIRHLLEWELNKVFPNPKDKYPAHSCENHPEVANLKEKERENKIKEFVSKCPICSIFGTSAAVGGTPTRLTVRDSFPTQETHNKWNQWLGERIYTELKTENAIDRVTSEANPRTMERVPKGSEFELEMIFDIYKEEDRQLLKVLFTGMHLLENSALGGSGSRGHGRIEFVFNGDSLQFRSVNYYKTGVLDEEEDNIIKALKNIKTVKEIIERFPTKNSASDS